MNKCEWKDGEFVGCDNLSNKLCLSEIHFDRRCKEVVADYRLSTGANYCKYCGGELFNIKEITT